VSHRVPIFAANWKMNKSLKEANDYIGRFQGLIGDIPISVGKDCELILCPQATHLGQCAEALKSTPFRLGAQNCGTARFGAFTGEISPSVLKEMGVEWVILGHSERRHVFKEDDYLIFSRVRAALDEGLRILFCVGEILQDRKAGKTFKIVEHQLSFLKQAQSPLLELDPLVVAYEPVWAIGTGENATPSQAQEIHAFIREWVKEKFSSEQALRLRILYGGSAKPENSAQLMAQPDVDGLLIGTASLDPVIFAGVIKNGLKSRSQEKNPC